MSKKQPVSADPLLPYLGLLDPAEIGELREAIARPILQALRVNPLKAPLGGAENSDSPPAAQAAADWAARYGWELAPVSFCPTGWQILSSRIRPSQTIEYKLGFYYLQDAASMLPAELFDFEPGAAPLVLDLAAAPGGKTTHLLGRTGDHGLVLANDASLARLPALRGVLQDWGATAQAVSGFPGEKFGAWFPNTFDAVLLDAPCSMDNLHPDPRTHKRAVSPAEHQALAARQLRLLESAVQACKEGGQVVYSTCTLAPEEDEGVLDAFLRRYPGAIRVEDISDRLAPPAPALSRAGPQTFLPQVTGAARLWPHRSGTAGFFAARLTRTGPLPVHALPAPNRPLAAAGFAPRGSGRQAAFCRAFEDRYGFDLAGLLANYDLEMWQRESAVYLFPTAFLRRFAGLPVSSLGLRLGEDTLDGFTLSHETAARFGQHFTRGRVELPADLVPAWLAGSDLPGLAPPPGQTGGVVVVSDLFERNLGRGRWLADRLKNLLPRRMVLTPKT